jgi:diacylglycerol kinase (ATP)
MLAGTYPFWGQGVGAIRLTTIPYPPPNLLRWGFSIARGKPSAARSGCMSRSAKSAEIDCREVFMLDGEYFDGPEQGALKIETGPALTYITG